MEEYSENEIPQENFDYDAFRGTKAFSTSVDKKLKAQIISYEVNRILTEQRFPFAAKISQQGLENAQDVLARVRLRKHSFLIENMLPERSYGVISAEYKAGKTWIVCELIVNALTCGAFLGKLKFNKPINEETNKPEDIKVVAFIGEGDEYEIISRLDAVARFYDTNIDELVATKRLLLQLSPPDLSAPETVQQIHSTLSEFKPHLTIIDPWYLSAGAEADSRNLQSMGVVLRNIQGVCQDVKSALLIMQHWNQSGEGKGFNRSTGAGLLEWGRVLGNLSIKSYIGEDPEDEHGTTISSLQLEFKGQVSGKYEFVRTVSREDKNDLSTPMYYSLENRVVVSEEEETQKDEKKEEFIILDDVWSAIEKHDAEWTKTEVVEEVAKASGIRIAKVRTIANYMERYELVEIKVLEKDESPSGQRRKVWKYPGELFVNAKREELRNGLKHEWNQLKIFRIPEKVS